MLSPPKGTPEAEAQGDDAGPSVAQVLGAYQRFAYALEHGTRPSTIGIVVGCNPVSLLSW
jgi:microsomal epoxide hydrolase